MSELRIMNESRGACLGDRIRVADRWWPRLRGLIGHAEPSEGQGLLIRPCQGVHMHWMTYPLDIAFVDRAGEVVVLYHALRPWRFSRTHRDATAAVELPAGTLRRTDTQIGDRISWHEGAAVAAA